MPTESPGEASSLTEGDNDSPAAPPDGQVILALEPSTLSSHPLRAMDVPCFIPKLIG